MALTGRDKQSLTVPESFRPLPPPFSLWQPTYVHTTYQVAIGGAVHGPGPPDDGADQHVAQHPDHKDDALEEGAHHGVVEAVVLLLLALGLSVAADAGVAAAGPRQVSQDGPLRRQIALAGVGGVRVRDGGGVVTHLHTHIFSFFLSFFLSFFPSFFLSRPTTTFFLALRHTILFC